MSKGIFVISLDYEIMWGSIFNKPVEAGYRYRTPFVKKIYPRLLELFKKYGIHATWAAVGGIACKDKHEAVSLASELIKDPYGSESLQEFILSIKPEDLKLYFDGKSIEDICNTPYQELGSHTFSHFYFYEHTNAEAKLNDELKSSKKALEKVSKRTVETLVMPKNQVDEGMFSAMRNNRITIYRGAQISERFNKRTFYLRAIRFADAYIPVRGYSTFPVTEIKKNEFYNVRASCFWRTFEKKLSIFEPLKVWRIKKQLSHAAQKGEVFHLWFHPHNLSSDYEKNLQILEEIFRYFAFLKDKYGMVSLNMKECADFCNIGDTL